MAIRSRSPRSSLSCPPRSLLFRLCRVKLLGGRVFQPQGVLLRKSDREFGYIHSCMAWPISDLEIMV